MHGTAKQNEVVEITFQTNQSYRDPFHDVVWSVIFTNPAGEKVRVPGFWAGGQSWKVRYASSMIGTHHYQTQCSDSANLDLHDQKGQIEVSRYEGNNPLLKHGAVRRKENEQYLEHQDGTPFLWLGDTWWMGLTKRLSWPEDFKQLTEDRKEKGFSVIQIIAGLYPDMDPFDPRGANHSGFPWEESFSSIRPDYFNEADQKITWLIEQGITPCIVGCWGFYLDFAGEDVIKKHWDYLLARYAAYPVVWCIAGEAVMPFYTHEAFRNPSVREEYTNVQRKGWNHLTQYVKERDPYQRLITIHPTNYGREMVEDPQLIDLEMLQTGHSSFQSLANTAKMVRESVLKEPFLPVINSEVCYEGICGTNYEDIQRFVFWSSMLSGACGHTYGANGIWQVNSKDEPYGPSPHGAAWGSTSWQEAYQLQGSKQVGIGKKLLEKYAWWKFDMHPEWLEKHANPDNYIAPYAAGIPGEVRVFFLPFLGGLGWGEVLVKQLEPDLTYRAYYFDPITGDTLEQGEAQADQNGEWRAGKVNKFQDWLLVLEII